MTFKCEEQLRIIEQFYSIQGESTYAGLPCHFIRLHGCNLRCEYCDTPYAYGDDAQFKLASAADLINAYMENTPKLVQFTGGEPLLQMNPLIEVCCELVKYSTILIETNGSLDIFPFRMAPANLVLIMDVKTPCSKMESKINYDNFKHLRPVDEVKFVISNYEDFQFTKQIVETYNLQTRCKPMCSPMFGSIDLTEMAKWILTETPYMRMQVQLHKIIWDPNTRGV
jgi:7-carboxy-7-deazaguanine synthase